MKFFGLLLVALVLAACNGSSGGSAAAPSGGHAGPHGLVGAWARADGPQTGLANREVYEFRNDGTWLLHQFGIGENGRYSTHGNTLTLDGSRKQISGWKQTYQIKGDDLTITSTLAIAGAPPGTPGFKEVTTWKYLATPPLVPTVDIGDLDAPEALPVLAAAALKLARTSNQNIQMVQIDAEQYLPGAFKLDFYMQAPDRSGVLVTMSPYNMRVNTFAQANWGDRPLPVDFIDLSKATEIAAANGLVGPMTKADFISWSNKGAYWRIFSHEGAVTVDALSGKIFSGDVSGYIDAYNADWDNALKKINEVIKAAMPKGHGRSWCQTLHDSSVSTCLSLNPTDHKGCEYAAVTC